MTFGPARTRHPYTIPKVGGVGDCWRLYKRAFPPCPPPPVSCDWNMGFACQDATFDCQFAMKWSRGAVGSRVLVPFNMCGVAFPPHWRRAALSINTTDFRVSVDFKSLYSSSVGRVALLVLELIVGYHTHYSLLLKTTLDGKQRKGKERKTKKKKGKVASAGLFHCFSYCRHHTIGSKIQRSEEHLLKNIPT